MNKKFDRNSIKQRGIKKIFKSFSYAKEGVIYTIMYEQNFIFHLIVASLVIIFGLIFKITSIEWFISYKNYLIIPTPIFKI